MAHRLSSVVVLVFLFNTVVCNNVGQTQDDLYKYLFNNYIKELKPICIVDEVIEVKIGMSFRQMFDVNVPKQFLSFNAWMRLYWQDCRLKWNTDDYNLKNITIPATDIWKPDITLFDHADHTNQRISGFDTYLATIDNDGSVYYPFPTVIEVFCKIDITYFPFDEQTCTVTFISWAYSNVNLSIGDMGSDFSNFVTNVEWEFVGVSVKSFTRVYPCCPETPWPHVSFDLTLKRKPLFQICNLILPCAAITAVSLFGFLLPPECGEKVSLEVTVLLSLAVFLFVVAEQLPASSDTIPYIQMHFLVSIMLVSLSTLFTTLVINIHYKGLQHRKVPRWLHWLSFRCIGPLMLVNSEWVNDDYESRASRASCHVPNINYCNANDLCGILSQKDGSDSNTQTEKETTSECSGPQSVNYGEMDHIMYPNMTIAKKQLKIMEKAEEKTKRQIKHQVLQDDWRQIGIIADRFLFFLFTLTLTFETTIMFSKMTGVF